MLRDKLLGPLNVHFLVAAQAYRDYLESGKSFLFACSLRRTNESARELLLKNAYLLPEENIPDALALLRHYDVWLTLWDELASRTARALDKPFAFENDLHFPKDAEMRLTALYRRSGHLH